MHIPIMIVGMVTIAILLLLEYINRKRWERLQREYVEDLEIADEFKRAVEEYNEMVAQLMQGPQ